ncbi:MAG: PAS domain S-box protein, partial [Gemmataceae bacterium]|nr:PAS domain S-box protein [Gemmataceae bacterium]
ALVAAAAVGATVAGAGPFVRADARESLLQLDVFLAVVAGTTLVMAAVMAERGAAEDDLRDSQAELRELNAALERRVADRAAELARSEAARRDTEDRFRAFTDHSPAVSFMKDEGGRMVFVSRACANRFRIDPADWLGKTDAELWPPALAEQLRANDRAVLDSGRPLDVVEEVADPDGTVHTWRSLKFSFRDAAGRRYVGGTAVDITDQRRAEAALRASEEEFRRLVDDSPIGIYRTTPDGRVLMANPAAVRLAGCGSFAELAAHNLEERGSHAGYDRAEFKRRLEADGEVLGLESVWRRPGKHPVYVRENARVVRGPGGGVLYYEGTAEDITDRRRAEETLRVLFECSSDAHLLFDPDWGIFDANPAAAAMLGFADKAELVGRHPAEFSPDYQPDGRLSLEKCVEMDGLARANGHHRFDWQHRRADGTDFPCEVTLTPVEIGGRTALLAVWHDLTDRKKAEDALRQSEEQFRLSFDQAAIGKALVAPDGRWLRVNRAVCEIVGYTEAELLARTFQDITHPDDLAADLDLVRRVLGGDLRTYQIEKRYVHKDGRAVWVLLSVSLVRDAAGDPVHFVSQIQDVTARKRAEDALRASEDRFRRAFDSSGIGMALAAADGRLLRVNPALGRLLGYDPGELVGATFQALTHPDDLAANLDLHADALAGRRDSYRLEKRYVHKDGHPVWAELTVAVMAAPGADGAVLVGQVQDVTARREAEARARKARADLLDAIEGLDAGLVVYGPDERLVVCNSRHRELYAAHADALRPGCRYEDVLRSYYRAGGAVQPPGVDEETWVAGRLRAHRNPGPAREWLHEGRWLLITDRPTRDGGVVSLRTDITALKLAQETAEAASKAKSEFLANMSHEIRTPMNAILGMTDLVLDTPLAPDQREFLRLARESGASLLRIINDILDFSKVEAGRLELEAAPFRLRDAVCRAVEPLAVRAAQKGLGLTCRVAPGVPDRVVGDAGRLGQVLVNLVGNAVKFTPRGEVVLSVGCGGLDGDEAELRFAVSDTGIGVPPEHRAAIFEAFVQADASLTRRFGGTGLGLAISAKLVGLMGGRIWVDSEEGQGSTFHFTVRLPVAAGADGPSRDGLVWVATAPGAARPVVPAGSG